MHDDLVELTFRLEPDEDDWPPYAVESLWCRREGVAFRLLTCPLFVKGLAVDDLIMADVESDPSTPTLCEVLSFELLQPSDHSTIWMLAEDEEVRQSLRERLDELGCRTEGGPAGMADLVAIDVPGTVTLSVLDDILDPYRADQKIEVVFPTLRHADTPD